MTASLILTIYFITTLIDLVYAAIAHERDKFVHLDKPQKTFFEYFLSNNVWTMAAILLGVVVYKILNGAL